ncbi:MAG: glycine/sarcosine/betaine reductase component B subunit [Firmicutes bacterium]|nr:glycine/sarcosine/betaine reductase component B subunit [Bacillota bacterium]
MALTIRRYRPETVAAGPSNGWRGSQLVIDLTQLKAHLEARMHIRVHVELVPPESGRVVRDIRDLWQVRAKLAPAALLPYALPGQPQDGRGSGVTIVVERLALCISGEGAGNVTPCMLPMGDPSLPLSDHWLLEVAPAIGPAWDESDEVRMKTALAEWMQAAIPGLQPPPGCVQEETWQEPAPTASRHPERPAIGHCYLVQSQGSFRRTFFQGSPCDTLRPTVVSPLVIMDGALVSNNYVVCANRNPTYFHAENPLLRGLLQRHGQDLQMASVVLFTAPGDEAAKRATAAEVAQIARSQCWDAAVVTKEGGGNTTVDLMLLVGALEAEGISAVGMVNESAGPQGDQPPLVVHHPAADALVSTGNVEAVWPGGTDASGGALTAWIAGATSLLGAGQWGCVED